MNSWNGAIESARPALPKHRQRHDPQASHSLQSDSIAFTLLTDCEGDSNVA